MNDKLAGAIGIWRESWEAFLVLRFRFEPAFEGATLLEVDQALLAARFPSGSGGEANLRDDGGDLPWEVRRAVHTARER